LAAFAHPCMGLFVKHVLVSLVSPCLCLFLLSWSRFFVRPQNRFFVPTMRRRQ
jgi:hypothetical protein